MKSIWLSENGDFTEAEELLNDNTQFEGTFMLTAKAVLALKRGDSTAFAQIAEKAFSVDKKKTNKWLRLYRAHLEASSSRDKAIRELKEALIIDKNFNLALIELGYLFSLTSECDSVVKYVQGVSRSFGDEECISFLGDAYYFCGDVDSAWLAYDSSNRIRENGFAYFGIATIQQYQRSNIKLAEHYYKKSLEFSRDKCNALNQLGWLYVDSGDFELAASYFDDMYLICSEEVFLSDYILFCLKTRRLRKAEDAVVKFASHSPDRFKVEGFRLVLQVISGKTSIEEQYGEVDRYYRVFGDEAAQWLNSVFEELNETSEVKIVLNSSSIG
ncbi:MAG: tetratricopeptide repeat protein [Cyclobacteriaceae bacterium]